MRHSSSLPITGLLRKRLRTLRNDFLHILGLTLQTGLVDDCEICDTVGAPGVGSSPWDIDATTEALLQRVSTGAMRELRHDVPLEDMIPLLESDLMYTITSFMECRNCERVLFWGLCIRGNPILRHADRAEVDRWPWSPAPPREQWARA